MSPTYTTCLYNKNTNHVTLMWGECFTHNLTNSGLGETSCETADERIAAHHGQAMQMMELLLWLLSASIEVKNRRAGSSKPASPVLQVVICNRSQPLRIGLVPRLVLACERPQLCICVPKGQHLVCFFAHTHTHAKAKSKSTNWLRIVSHWQET